MILNACRYRGGPAALLLALAVAAPARAAAPPVLIDGAACEQRLARIAADARPGVLGVFVTGIGTRGEAAWNGDRWFPMQSVFKGPLGAMVLARVDEGRLALDSTIVLGPADVSVPWSDIGDHYPERTRYRVSELLEACVGSSDNMAADLLLRMVGGPRALTDWLRGKGIAGIRVDHYERDIQPAIEAMGPFRPEWKSRDAFVRAMLQVPEPQRRAAQQRYLRSGEDALTPRGAVEFLTRLQEGRLLGPESTRRLLRIMTESATGPGRIRAGLPPGASLAHKTGTARTDLGVTPATNDIGIVTLADGRRFALAVLLSASTAPDSVCDAVLANVTRAVVASLR